MIENLTPRRRHEVRTTTSTTYGTCRGCQQPIEPGEPEARDRTGSRFHGQCRRRDVRPTVAPGPRFLVDPHEGAECPGCGTELHADDVVVHVLARPWHADCRQRDSGRL